MVIPELSTNLTIEQGKHLAILLQSRPGQAAFSVLKELKSRGFEAYFAGGCVRDLLLGRIPNDFDIASNASPDEVESFFTKTIAVGKQFGIVVVVEDGVEIEVARFRGERGYHDGRHPEEIFFADAKQDSLRRDFTINALYLDVEKARIIDYVGGTADLRENILRAVGDAEMRFSEDHLRILRALRFVAQLGCQLDRDLELAISKNANLVQDVSRERFFTEWGKLLSGTNARTVLEWVVDHRLMEQFFPTTKSERQQVSRCFESQKPWLSFWIFLFESGTSKDSLLAIWKGLRAANSWKQEIEHGMSWFFNEKNFAQLSLGEILEISYQAGSHQGLLSWARLRDEEMNEKLIRYRQRRQEMGDQLPSSLLKGEDLQKYCQGQELGRRLKLCFWAQLEGQIDSKDQALKLALKEMGLP